MGLDAILTVALVPGLVLGGQEQRLVAGRDVALPKKLVYVEPVYPASASGIQGLVVIEFMVDTKGEPRQVRVLRSIPAFDAAVLEAVKEWRYEPTVVDGVTREVVLRVPVPLFTSENDAVQAYADIAKRKKEDTATRLFAIEGLADLGAKRRKQVTKTLQGLLRDSEERIRSAAEKALKSLQAVEK